MAADQYNFIDPVEQCPWRSPRAIFAERGYRPVAPAELDDRQLPGRLWELLYAAAARRFFFHETNHLSDRGLYTLLWEQWLDELTADIPLEAETNTTTFVSELDTGQMTHEELWLRYYATARDYELLDWEPNRKRPAHEDPPYDRDRFLPAPPVPLEPRSGWLPEEDEPALEPGCEVPGLPDAEDGTAACKNEEQAEAAEAEEQLEAELAAAEPEHWVPPAQQLTNENIPLLPPAEVTDETLTPILWELLHNLALRGFYVLHSDHLSEREVYAKLWQRGLREPAHLPGRNARGGWFHDFLGSWGKEEMRLWLRYYASDQERAQHAKESPAEVLPPKEQPPHHRDWRLPKGPC